jgi:hypothetical protein
VSYTTPNKYIELGEFYTNLIEIKLISLGIYKYVIYFIERTISYYLVRGLRSKSIVKVIAILKEIFTIFKT